MASVHPELARLIQARQYRLEDDQSIADQCIDWVLARCGESAHDLAPLLTHSCPARLPIPALTGLVAGVSNQHLPLGFLLGELLQENAVTACQLLQLPRGPQLVARALVELHDSAPGGHGAFSALLKSVVICGEAQRPALLAMLSLLRLTWTSRTSSQRAPLLQHLVEVIHAEVFPRSLATNLILAELEGALAGAEADRGVDDDRAAAAWNHAMVAFAYALPTEPLFARLRQLAASVMEGTSLHCTRTAALLVAAQSATPNGAATVSAWIGAITQEGMQNRSAPLVRTAILLQRQLCATPDAYRAWLHAISSDSCSVAGENRDPALHMPQRGQLAFLVQGVLIPLLPEEDSLNHLREQTAVMVALQAAAPPPATAAVLQEYVCAAGKRRKALEEQQLAAEAGGTVSSFFSAPSEAHLIKGEAAARRLLAEFVECGGRLRPATVTALVAKAKNVFQKGELIHSVLPWLLRPTPDADACTSRAALLAYLAQEFTVAGSSLAVHLSRHTLARYTRLCRAAHLEGGSLADAAACVAARLGGSGDVPSLASRPSSGSTQSSQDGVHPLLDRLGRRVAAAVQCDAPAQFAEVAQQLVGVFAGCEALDRGALAVVVHVVYIALQHPQLHEPFLRQLQQAAEGDAAAGCSQRVAAVMVAAVGAARIAPLQPPVSIFAWQLRSAVAGQPEGSNGWMGGLQWVRQVCASLPLHSADAMQRAADFAAAHISAVASVFDGQGVAVLSDSPNSRDGSHPRQPPYEGDVNALAAPLCVSALRLLQWRQLRLAVAARLLHHAGAGPPAKKQRMGERHERACASAVQMLSSACSHAGSAQLGADGSPHALTLGGFLCLEMHSAGAGSDEVPLWARQAVAEECCRHFVGRSVTACSPSGGLASASASGLQPCSSASDAGAQLASAIVGLPAHASSAAISTLFVLGRAVAAALAAHQPAAGDSAGGTALLAAVVVECRVGMRLEVVPKATGGQGLQLLSPPEQIQRLQQLLTGLAASVWQAGSGSGTRAIPVRALQAAIVSGFEEGVSRQEVEKAIEQAAGPQSTNEMTTLHG